MPIGYKDIRFPTDISYGSSGGPQYNTSVVSFKSGKEKRNSNWEYPQSSYDVAYGIEEYDKLEKLVEMFHITQGRGYTFRYKDPLDHKSCKVNNIPSPVDQLIGTSDGAKTDFQLYKTYYRDSIDGSVTYSKVRKITKPVRGTVLAAVSGEETTDFEVDYNSGMLKFNSPPPSGEHSITAGFEFDVHARFDVDEISVNLEDYKVGSIDVPVIEVKD